MLDCMKICTKCGIEKPVSEFGKHKRMRDGLVSYCKACHNAASAAWTAANRERKSATNAAWAAAHPGYKKAASAARYAANPERHKAARAARYAANPEKQKAASAARYAANPDKAKATTAAWQAANTEKLRIYNHNRRAREKGTGGKLSTGLTERLFKLQNGRCPCCGHPLGTDFHVDHIIPLKRGGSNEDFNCQLLRSTCNHQKSAKDPIDFMQQRGFLL